RAIRMLEGKEKFDIVFMDPPYEKGLEKQVLEHPSFASLLTEDALIIAEASLQTDFDYLEEAGYCLERRKEYKTNMHVFIRRIKQ
ncbi:MAG: RsmD family RNA methyltransferase, partial [Lachnospiraceae bacterium]|nr:RsmD family RNA methyltransferase [Lachnospiraceae bacterium]